MKKSKAKEEIVNQMAKFPIKSPTQEHVKSVHPLSHGFYHDRCTMLVSLVRNRLTYVLYVFLDLLCVHITRAIRQAPLSILLPDHPRRHLFQRTSLCSTQDIQLVPRGNHLPGGRYTQSGRAVNCLCACVYR